MGSDVDHDNTSYRSNQKRTKWAHGVSAVPSSFFDEMLGLYIYTNPLSVSSKILKAAKALGFSLEWDEDGHICSVDHDEAMQLSASLGIVTLNVREYMKLAKRNPAVASSEFAEWLTDIYTIDEAGKIHNAETEVLLPFGRPRWFEVGSIDDQGLPGTTSGRSGGGQWKYWSPNPESPSMRCGALRSFVTSSGTCSLDFGVPTFAKHPKMMIRECYRTPKVVNFSRMDEFWNQYNETILTGTEDQMNCLILSQDLSTLGVIRDADTPLNHREQEFIIDIKGKRRLLTKDFEGLQQVNIEAVKDMLSQIPTGDTIYVIGHPHPDADSVITSVFEAVRRRHVYRETSCVAWNESVPSEVANLLTPEVTEMLQHVPKYTDLNDIVLVDCHQIGDLSVCHIKAIIDHHIIQNKFPNYVGLSQDRSWSSTIQVYIKMLGSGLDVDAETALILAEASILEAEPQLLDRCPELDRLALSRLVALAGPTVRSYGALRNLMIDGNKNLQDEFFKDYRETTYGFAVIHCKEFKDFTSIVHQHISQNSLPLCIVKQVLAQDNDPWVAAEQITFFFNSDSHDKGFRNAIHDVGKAACEAFHPGQMVQVQGDTLTLHCRSQTPRPWLSMHIEKIVREHLKFYYAKDIHRYVSSGFYSGTNDKYTDQEGEPFTALTYRNVKRLLKGSLNTSFLTLPQYWQVYNSLTSNKHFRARMTDKHYVELLDTVIVKKNSINNQIVEIDPAIPALITPGLVNASTGIPLRSALHSPNIYSDPALWRYWSPDRAENVATRGHIFLLDRTALDLKVGPDDRTSKLTFRPVYRDIPDLKYTILLGESEKWGRDHFNVRVMPRAFGIFEMDEGVDV